MSRREPEKGPKKDRFLGYGTPSWGVAAALAVLGVLIFSLASGGDDPVADARSNPMATTSGEEQRVDLRAASRPRETPKTKPTPGRVLTDFRNALLDGDALGLVDIADLDERREFRNWSRHLSDTAHLSMTLELQSESDGRKTYRITTGDDVVNGVVVLEKVHGRWHVVHAEPRETAPSAAQRR